MAADADGREVELGPPRRRALLALLLMRIGHVVPTQQLLDELWGDRLPERALASLHSYISHLRRALAQHLSHDDRTRIVRRVSGGYVLDLPREQVDVHRFEDAVTEGRRLHRQGRHAGARDRLGAALEMWRGAPYEELIDYPPLAEESERLARVRLSALETWADALLTLGDPEPVADLDAEVQAHPGRERLAALVMTAQYYLGRQADALSVYTRTRDWLAHELGVDAGEELQRIHRAILRQELPARPARPPGTAGPGTTGPVSGSLADLPHTLRENILPGDAAGTSNSAVEPLNDGTSGTGRTGAGPSGAREGGPAADGALDIEQSSASVTRDGAGRGAAALPGAPARELAAFGTASPPASGGEAYGSLAGRGPAWPQPPGGAGPWRRSSLAHPAQPVAPSPDAEPGTPVAPAAPFPGTLPPEPGQRPFVGRDHELAALRVLVSDVLCGNGRLAAVLGEPGIGKSRLLGEVAERLRNEPLEVVRGHCFAGRDAPPYWLWTQVLRQLAASRADAYRSVTRSFGDLLAPLFDGRPDGSDADGRRDRRPDAAADRFRTYDAVCETLLTLADAFPLLLLLEDLHWADAPSLHLLRLLTSRLNGRCLGIVVSARTWEIERDAALGEALGATLWSPRTETVRLMGLPEDAVRVIVSAVSGPGVARETIQYLHERSRGNPYFVHQLMSLLGDASRLHDPQAARMMLTRIPSGVKEVLTRRFESLPTATRDLLRLCAVIGSEIDLRLLTEVAGRTGAAGEELEPAIRSQLLAEDPARPGQLHFTHALVRETLYGELTLHRRSELHALVAQTLATRGTQAPGCRYEGVERLAHHAWEASHALPPAQALPALCRAAEEAELRLAYEQAELWLRRAIDLVRLLPGEDSSARLLEQRLHIQLGQTLATTRGYGDAGAEAAFTRSRALNPVTGAPDQPTVLWSLCTANLVTGRYDAALRFSDRLRAMPGRPQDPVAYLGARYGRGIVLHVRGSLPEALDQLEDAVDRADALGEEGGRRVARHFQHDPRISCRSYDAFTHWLLGDTASASTRRAELLALTSRDSRPNDRAFALYVDAVLAGLEGDVHTARRSGELGREVAGRYGLHYWRAMLSVCEGWAVAHGGEGERGIALLRSGVTGLTASGTFIRLPLHLGFLAEALYHVGRTAEAVTTLAQLTREVEARGERVYLHDRLLATGLMRLLPGDVVEPSRRGEARPGGGAAG
ncbi:BTAD domain-containing putative transcriptional regulator [Streptomyces sp. NPDC005931]|uniref:BTAD domain-containing putative transcriptional regulator n=1 Tax=Streptomyces sp. NPDC005931 TaxID=3364737 RepID=UPI0036AA3EB7